MSHERPRGGEKRPAPERRPAGWGDPAPRGVKPALVIFGTTLVVEAAIIARLEATEDYSWVSLGLVVAVIAGIAALIASARLPRGERWPFWVVCATCVGMGFILLAYTCGRGIAN